MYSDKAQGKAIIFSAPSGAGKTTIVHHLLSCNLGLEFSVSACSRAMRKGEANGVDYYFLSVEEFRKKIANKEKDCQQRIPGMGRSVHGSFLRHAAIGN